MVVKFDNKELSRIVKSIFKITGISITVIDTDRNEVRGCGLKDSYCDKLAVYLEQGRSICYNCDTELLEKCKRSKKIEHHICHAGLCDFAMPLIKDDVIIGYVLMGRVRLKNSLYNQKYNLKDNGVLNHLYYELPVISNEQIEAVADLMQYILFEHAITIERDQTIEIITDYIKNNLKEKLSVEVICSEFNISKNALYGLFAKKLNTPVNQYIIDMRMTKAKSLLNNSNMSISQIAQEVGIYNQTYFCKLFKKEVGISPKGYRKNI